MPYEDCKSRLMDYFGNITYIDDTFDRCLVEDRQPLSENVSKAGPPLPIPGDPDSSSDSDDAVEIAGANDSAVNLLSLLEAMNQEKYKRIHLHPVLYTEKTQVNQLCEKIKDAPLTIIDWNLGESKTAFSIIDELLAVTKQLKVIIVYTASYDEAINDLESQDAEKYKFMWKEEENNISYYKLNSKSLLVLAQKNRYDILALMDKVSDCFISFYGIMPIALLDYMESIRQLSDSLINVFCNPFDSLYMLQMYYSETSKDEVPNLLTSFIQNRIETDCKVSTRIISELFQWNRERLKEFIDNNSEASETIFNSILGNMALKLNETQKYICDAIKNCGYEEFKKCCTSLIEEKNGRYIDANRMADYIKIVTNIEIEKQTEKVMECKSSVFATPEGKAAFEEIKQKIKINIELQNKEKIGKAISQFLPLLIQIIITGDRVIPSVVDLVSNMKVKKYSDQTLKNQLCITQTIPKKERADFLLNKIHFGDILAKKKENGEIEYLLCMTPPCDAFRPAKTACNYTFIRGKVIKKEELISTRKESFHPTVLPSFENENEVSYVGWKLYDIVMFNLKEDADFESICSYRRPFILTEPYARQISSKLTAYYSRAGVDELFIKSEENLRCIFY